MLFASQYYHIFWTHLAWKELRECMNIRRNYLWGVTIKPTTYQLALIVSCEKREECHLPQKKKCHLTTIQIIQKIRERTNDVQWVWSSYFWVFDFVKSFGCPPSIVTFSTINSHLTPPVNWSNTVIGGPYILPHAHQSCSHHHITAAHSYFKSLFYYHHSMIHNYSFVQKIYYI